MGMGFGMSMGRVDSRACQRFLVWLGVLQV